MGAVDSKQRKASTSLLHPEASVRSRIHPGEGGERNSHVPALNDAALQAPSNRLRVRDYVPFINASAGIKARRFQAYATAAMLARAGE